MVLVLIAVCVVVLCVLAAVHLLAKLIGWLRTAEKEGPKEPVASYSRHPDTSRIHPSLNDLPKPPPEPEESKPQDDSTHTKMVRQMSLFQTVKEQMKNEMNAADAESRWKGYQEIRRDEYNRKSTSMMYQRSALGVMSIAEVDPEGKFIVIANTSGLRARGENISEWQIVRRVGNGDSTEEEEMVYTFPPDTFVRANCKTTIWERDGRHDPPEHFVLEDRQDWGSGGTTETFLINSKGEAQASVFWNTETIQMD